MKWLKSRSLFLNEAKIRDVILPRQKTEFIRQWGEKYLDYEEVDPTDKIKQGKWKLDEKDKNKVLSAFFSCDMERIFKDFDTLPEQFSKLLSDSLDFTLLSGDLKEKTEIIFENFNPKKPTVDQISMFTQPIFRSISVGETKAVTKIERDENGRPLKDEEGKIIKVEKKSGDVVYSQNVVSLRGFCEDYNKCYEKINHESLFFNSDVSNLISMSQENHNRNFKFDFKIFDRDLYISINHNPRDILNMSISRFYASCMHLYSGGYRSQLLSNVFDPNSIPAFLKFDTEIYWDDNKISDFLPLSRMMVRNIETFDNDEKEAKIFYDRAYPDRMQTIFSELLDKYTGNKCNVSGRATYMFMPDIDPNDSLSRPYMDRLGISQYPYIGNNTKSLYLNRSYDWSRIKISPKAKIKEIVVETESLPDNFKDISLKPEWIKFKFMNIRNLDPFNKIITKSLAFDKCRFKMSTLDKLAEEVEKLQIISCDILDGLDFSKFTKLKELQLLYTLDNIDDYKEIIENLKLDKLILSGDLFSSKDGKEYLKSLKKKMKIEIIGPLV